MSSGAETLTSIENETKEFVVTFFRWGFLRLIHFSKQEQLTYGGIPPSGDKKARVSKREVRLQTVPALSQIIEHFLDSRTRVE
jgi:hypothetical protein